MSLVVDRLRKEDLDGALRLSTQAGWNQMPGDWLRLLDLCPEGCFAGRLDGSLVATATLASYGARVHWVGMVLVDAACRGKGLGGTMLARTLEHGRSLGGTVGLDATDLGRPVYLKQGFVDVAPIDRWSGVLRGSGDGGDVEMITRSAFDDVVKLDRESCGADRSGFLLHLMNEPGVFGVAAVGAGLQGFAFLRPGRTTAHVGPVVAANVADARSLLSRLARLADGAPVLMDAIRTPATTDLLEKSGLTVARKLTRMTLDRADQVLMGERICAITSFEWG
jgi:GNAT superfamily N-acetyltransferase